MPCFEGTSQDGFSWSVLGYANSAGTATIRRVSLSEDALEKVFVTLSTEMAQCAACDRRGEDRVEDERR